MRAAQLSTLLQRLGHEATEKRTTHDRFYKTVEERDSALCETFGTFQTNPKLIANHVARCL